MAARNFKPKASSNILEGVTPVDSSALPDEGVVAENISAPAEEGTPVRVEPEAPETNTSPVATAPTVTFEDKASKAPVQKNVKVCLRVNHSCTIGGVTYHFVKGKQTNVPADVKAILLKADLLMPL